MVTYEYRYYPSIRISDLTSNIERLKIENDKLKKQTKEYEEELNSISSFVKYEMSKLDKSEVEYGRLHIFSEVRDLIKSLRLDYDRKHKHEMEVFEKALADVDEFIYNTIVNANAESFYPPVLLNPFDNRTTHLKKMIKLVQDKSYQKGHKDWKKNYEELWDKMQKVLNEA